MMCFNLVHEAATSRQEQETAACTEAPPDADRPVKDCYVSQMYLFFWWNMQIHNIIAKIISILNDISWESETCWWANPH